MLSSICAMLATVPTFFIVPEKMLTKYCEQIHHKLENWLIVPKKKHFISDWKGKDGDEKQNCGFWANKLQN